MRTPELVLVTGASQGIGAAIAQALTEAGYHPLLLARSFENLEKIAEKIRAGGGGCTTLSCDVTRADEVDRALQQIQEQHGKWPLMLVNNAGWGGPFHRADEVSESEWDYIFAVNVKSAYLFCRRLLPVMQEAAFGRIVNIASVFGVLGGAGSSTYAASKHALIGYSKSIAAEWAAWNITSNVISPGYIQTSMTEAVADPDWLRAVTNRIPAGRLGTPEEIARLAVFLLQPESAYVNGANFIVDGGFTAT